MPDEKLQDEELAKMMTIIHFSQDKERGHDPAHVEQKYLDFLEDVRIYRQTET